MHCVEVEKQTKDYEKPHSELGRGSAFLFVHACEIRPPIWSPQNKREKQGKGKTDEGIEKE